MSSEDTKQQTEDIALEQHVANAIQLAFIKDDPSAEHTDDTNNHIQS